MIYSIFDFKSSSKELKESLLSLSSNIVEAKYIDYNDQIIRIFIDLKYLRIYGI